MELLDADLPKLNGTYESWLIFGTLILVSTIYSFVKNGIGFGKDV